MTVQIVLIQGTIPFIHKPVIYDIITSQSDDTVLQRLLTSSSYVPYCLINGPEQFTHWLGENQILSLFSLLSSMCAQFSQYLYDIEDIIIMGEISFMLYKVITEAIILIIINLFCCCFERLFIFSWGKWSGKRVTTPHFRRLHGKRVPLYFRSVPPFLY